MKKLTTALLTGSALLLFTACGSSGSSSSGTTTPVAPLYSTIQDLEFKTLNIKEIWNHSGEALYTTMKFTNNYIYKSDEKPLLVDNASSQYYAKVCGVAPADTGYTYLCVGVFYNGGGTAWGINIDNGGIITGNFHYSPIGDTNAMAAALANPSTAHAYLEGGVSNTVATDSGILIASTDGVGGISEEVVPNVDNDIDREALYSDLASNIVQPTTTKEVNPEIQQAINELHEILLQIQSEK